jgi:signal transduction histidine kinase
VAATQQSVFAIVGIPTEAAFAASDRELRTDLLAGAAVGGIALIIALLLSEASVARPLRMVVATVRRLGHGDLEARTGPVAGGSEINELAHSVDDMAGDLQARDQSLREASEEREHLLGELLNAQEDERRRIASDIHDDTIQTMIAAGLEVQLLRQDLAGGGAAGDDTEGRARDVERTIQGSVGRLRHLMFELEPPHSEEGLEASIELYLDAVLAATSVVVEVISDGAQEPSGAARQVMYRNIREAAVNAVRHGGASRVTVELHAEEGGLAVDVTDDGSGFDSSVEPPMGHHGLRTIQRRTEALSGRFRVDSAPDRGTTLSFWLPD